MNFFVIIAIFVASCFMTGCQKEEEEINESVEFLDLDISALSSEIQESDRLIVEAAKDRIDPYVIYENGQYKISIKSGRQIQISDRLFQMFINTIESSNQSLNELKSNTGVAIVQDIKDKKILHIVELKNSVRLKSGNPESPIPIGYSGIDWRWYGYDLYLTNQAANNYAYNVTMAADAATAVAYGCAYLKLYGVSALAGLDALWFSNVATRVLHYNGPNGVIIRCYAGVPFVYTR
jgi:hypothetical protein